MSKYHSKKYIRRFILFPIIVIIIGGGIVFWRMYGNNPYSEGDTTFGVTFSTMYSKELGLDWKELYTQSLDDLGIRHYRIPVYWNEIEPVRGHLHLDDIQWIMDQAAERDAKIMLAIGQRVPRWPECHPPDWTKNLASKEVQELELDMMRTIVDRFKDHPALYRWQVQNEPFFAVFGECAQPDELFIARSVKMVREMDPDKQIVITDSGELSTWIPTATLADVLGISMYRVTWNSFWGYFYYPLPPSHYSKKADVVDLLVDDVIVTELQVEPWVPTSMLTTSLEEQSKSMDLKRFNNNIEYAKRTGFSEVYLWGVEWWYWLREVHNQEEMWNAGKKVFEVQ